MRTLLQVFIRGDEITAEYRETDEIGRDLPILSIRAPVGPALREAVTGQLVALLAEQDAVIADAKADVADGKVPKRLVADLVEKGREALAIAEAATGSEDPKETR